MVNVLTGPICPPAVADLIGGRQAAETAMREMKVSEIAERLKHAPQKEMPVTHRFSPGIYSREIFMPSDTFVIGAVHKHRHLNIVLTGRAKVNMEGEIHDIKAGDVFESGAGVQKILYILEDMRWLTIHANPTDCQDIPRLEEAIVEISPDLLEAKGSLTLDQFRLSLAKSLTE